MKPFPGLRCVLACKPLLVLGCLMAIVLPCAATSSVKAEAQALIKVRNLLQPLAPGNGLLPQGIVISNWNLLRQYIPYRDNEAAPGASLDEINYNLSLALPARAPLEKSYVFVHSTNISEIGGHLILLGAAPVSNADHRGKGRYAIVRSSQAGSCVMVWLREAQIERWRSQGALQIPEVDLQAVQIANEGLLALKQKRKAQEEEMLAAAKKFQQHPTQSFLGNKTQLASCLAVVLIGAFFGILVYRNGRSGRT